MSVPGRVCPGRAGRPGSLGVAGRGSLISPGRGSLGAGRRPPATLPTLGIPRPPQGECLRARLESSPIGPARPKQAQVAVAEAQEKTRRARGVGAEISKGPLEKGALVWRSREARTRIRAHVQTRTFQEQRSTAASRASARGAINPHLPISGAAASAKTEGSGAWRRQSAPTPALQHALRQHRPSRRGPRDGLSAPQKAPAPSRRLRKGRGVSNLWCHGQAAQPSRPGGSPASPPPPVIPGPYTPPIPQHSPSSPALPRPSVFAPAGMPAPRPP